MTSDQINIKQFKTLPMRKKILSEWIFPLSDNDGLIGNEKEKNTQNYELNNLTLSVKPNFEQNNEFRSSRVQTYPFLSEVSEKNSKIENSTVSRPRNSSYGAFLHPLSSKNVTFYKKRAPSTDVANINELNITSYRNFKIRSPLKRSKNKSTNLKEFMLEKDVLEEKRFTKIRMGKILPKKKSEEREELSTNSNVKIKWEHAYNTLEISLKIRNYIEEDISSKDRKNSICAWDNEENSHAYE